MKISEIRASIAASGKDLISFMHVYYIFHACASCLFSLGIPPPGGGEGLERREGEGAGGRKEKKSGRTGGRHERAASLSRISWDTHVSS
jgi:hypothetical protein